jgi:hypothetical protein
MPVIIPTGIAVIAPQRRDYSRMSIEHIAPEHPSASAPPEKGVGTLGNLLLLEEGANNKIGNKGFTAKRTLYESAGTPLDNTLKNASKWTSTEIASRTKALAKLAHEKVFKV